MNKAPFISILISNYNYDKYILRCLNSCVNQTFKDFEIIVVDDASTDNSVSVIEDFIHKNSEVNISLIQLASNGGPAKAKGTALIHAKGKYIILVDSDDWMDDLCLETLVECAKETNADKIRAQVRTYDEERNKIVRERRIPAKTNKWCEGMLAATLIKRDLFTNNGIEFFPDRNVSDDLYLATQINRFSKSEEYIRETVYTISYKTDSHSGVGSFDMNKKLLYSYRTNEEVRKIWNDLSQEDKLGCEYLFTKQYFFLLIQFSRAVDFNEISEYHKKLFSSFICFFPNYYKNKLIRSFPNGDMFFAQIIVCFFTLFERIKILNLFLKIYWIFSRKINITTR